MRTTHEARPGFGRTAPSIHIKLSTRRGWSICLKPLRKRTDVRTDSFIAGGLIHRLFGDMNLKVRAPKRHFRLGSFPLNYKIKHRRTPLPTEKWGAGYFQLNTNSTAPNTQINRPFGLWYNGPPSSITGVGRDRIGPPSSGASGFPHLCKKIEPEEFRVGAKTLSLRQTSACDRP